MLRAYAQLCTFHHRLFILFLMPDNLSISLVIYYPDEAVLAETLNTLYHAADFAKSNGVIEDFYLVIVDNSASNFNSETYEAFKMRIMLPIWSGRMTFLVAPHNLGYGRGHNLAINERCENFHLILNPDVILNQNAVLESIHYLRQYSQVGMVTPISFRLDGQQEYLCKRYPTLWILFLRGFAPKWLKQWFKAQLVHYELSDLDNSSRNDVLIASGCFMFFRKQALLDVDGFSERFFLYFEDFDLSLRLLRFNWQIAFVPAVKIIHHGGHSAKKGYQHIRMFVQSAGLFFSRHGWRFW